MSHVQYRNATITCFGCQELYLDCFDRITAAVATDSGFIATPKPINATHRTQLISHPRLGGIQRNHIGSAGFGALETGEVGDLCEVLGERNHSWIIPVHDMAVKMISVDTKPEEG